MLNIKYGGENMTFNIEERKKQRDETLIKAYSHYYNGEYLGYSVSLNLQEKTDRETYLAYIYLKEKKYIHIFNHHSTEKFNVEITASGIDRAEEIIKGYSRD